MNVNIIINIFNYLDTEFDYFFLWYQLHGYSPDFTVVDGTPESCTGFHN